MSEQNFEFDVFISHNSHDKPTVRGLLAQLEAYELIVWYDEDELPPGVAWQPLLERGIKLSRSVAVLVGNDGLGPWENEEMQAALQFAVRDGRAVIPVLLPDAPAEPSLPLFLSNRTWVDFRGGFSAELLDKLVWGITRIKPAKPPSARGLSAGNASAGTLGQQNATRKLWEEKRDYLRQQRTMMASTDQEHTLQKTIEEMSRRIRDLESTSKTAISDQSNRPVSIGGSATRNVIVTGDKNVTSLQFTQTTLRPADSVDIQAELLALRELLVALRSDDGNKISRAMEDAQDEASKREPDREEIGDAVARALKYAQQSADFAEKITSLQSHISKVVSWLGAGWDKLLSIVGLTL